MERGGHREGKRDSTTRTPFGMTWRWRSVGGRVTGLVAECGLLGWEDGGATERGCLAEAGYGHGWGDAPVGFVVEEVDLIDYAASAR
jgi:hypothetical protein